MGQLLQESGEEVGEIPGSGYVFVQTLANAMLEEDGAFGHLEDGVVGGVAELDLVLDLADEVVVLVFSFPEAVALLPLVNQRAVHGDAAGAAFHRVFGDEGPVHFLAVAGEDILESTADGAFVVEVELTEAAENVVIALDELVGGLNSNGEHVMGGVYH